MTILVLAEHNNQALNSATLNALNAAQQIRQHNSASVDLLLAGAPSADLIAAAAALEGVDRLMIANDAALADQLAEDISPVIKSLADENSYSHILAAATSHSKDTLPRVAALLDTCQLSEVIAVEDANTFKRPIYAGNAIATVRSEQPTTLLTIRSSAFDAVATQGGNAEQVAVGGLAASGLNQKIDESLVESERPELTSAGVVISGGRGVGSAENFALLETIADQLGAAIGASRAAVDAGYVSNDLQVGQTGKVVAPALYIAVGISGAIQHLAGMKDSGTIVAINSDPEAPIFQIADYGLVADLFKALPELSEKLKEIGHA